MFRAVAGHQLAHLLDQRVAVLALVQVDEVDHDDAAHIAQPELTRDFGRGGQVHVHRRALLIVVDFRPVAAVDVHDVQRLGVLDDQVGALFERDVLAEQRHVEVVEDRRAAFVQLDDLFLVRGDHPDVFADLLVHGVVVDVYAAERPVEQVADDRRRAVFLVQDQRRGRLVAQVV